MTMRNRTDLLLLVAFCGFLFFYGLGSFGLVGADEPRYAQIAREMLDRHDWVTPTLHGEPWLEKPVLYYWQAMLSYSVFGVSDRAARVPVALDAALMIAAIYFFLRRFRAGSEMDGSLIAAGCAGVVGFARGASTDMPLAAMFAITMLAWYAWYETRNRLLLAAFYLFLALATLAKGPVAILLATVILLAFATIRRDRKAVSGTLWVPGIVLFLAAVLPWYIAVQFRNPQFFRIFILEHNLARFGQDLYHHPQPFWFFVPVLFVAVMPWTLWFLLAIAERARLLWTERREAFAAPEDSRQLFLLIWLAVPMVFFSASHSKLPGYILPAVPPASLLVLEYLRARRDIEAKPALWKAATHGVLCGLVVFGAFALPTIKLQHHLVRDRSMEIAGVVSVVVAIAITVALVRLGMRVLRPATMLAVLLAVGAILRFASPTIDATESARPIAQSILSFSHETVPVALYGATRQQQYGLEFYLNRAAVRYEKGQIPSESHVLVAVQNSLPQFGGRIRGRHVSFLVSIPAQKVDLYWVK